MAVSLRILKKQTHSDMKTLKPAPKAQCAIHSVVCSASKRKPWNWGKRKPVEDDCGNKWCNCVEPKLVSNGGGRGQAYCLLCGEFWYH